jgi:S-adenosylmethionine synthetase
MNNKAFELIKEALELLVPKEAKLTLSETVVNGQKCITNAVESVIAKHEKEIEEANHEKFMFNLRMDGIEQQLRINNLHYRNMTVTGGFGRGLLGGWS